MKKCRFRKGFTLIELLIVIAIIGILATIVVVSYVGAQVKSRDNKRKIDVQAIASAYQIHYQETKTWKFSGAELQKMVPPPDASITGEGWTGGGAGWFNYELGSYYVSMAHALTGLGYMQTAPRDPQIPSDDNYTYGAARQYMKYPDCGGIVVYARLESSASVATPYSESDLFPVIKSGTGNCYTGLVARQGSGMNYGVNVK